MLRRRTPAVAAGLALAGCGSSSQGDVRDAFDDGVAAIQETQAATRDARRANVELGRGAKLLRSAGRLLGIRVGRLGGY